MGGVAIVATRHLAATIDPITIGFVRFGGAFVILMPLTLRGGGEWPPPQDRPHAALLGVCLFVLFPLLFNASLVFTTAARGALALSTTPLLTMAAGVILRVERSTLQRIVGVLIATTGVGATLASSLGSAPSGAWRGDLLMVAAGGCMALYNVCSPPFLARSAALPFATFGIGVGAACLLLLSLVSGGLSALTSLGTTQWLAVAYLSPVGGALLYYCWAFALGRTSPTIVAVAVLINPMTAGLLGALVLKESVPTGLLFGLVTVVLGIALAQRSRPDGPNIESAEVMP